MQVSRTCLDRRYWAVAFDSYEGEALRGFRHCAQKSIVLFGPSFVLLTAEASEAGPRVANFKKTQLISEHGRWVLVEERVVLSPPSQKMVQKLIFSRR